MELRIFRSWSWVPDCNSRMVGPPQYKLISQHELQYKTKEMLDWRPIPIVEGTKPKHPDDIRREQDMKELNLSLEKMIEQGLIKL